MTRDEALAKLARDCQASAYPSLDSTELSGVLDSFTDWTDWVASTAVVEGDRRKFVGRVYRCVLAGTTGTEEPEPALYCRKMGNMLFDGSARWIDCGPVQASAYNLRGATRAAFELKMAKVAGSAVDVSDADAKYSRSQVMANLETMANRYRTLSVS
jgi:hypothetical protein